MIDNNFPILIPVPAKLTSNLYFEHEEGRSVSYLCYCEFLFDTAAVSVPNQLYRLSFYYHSEVFRPFSECEKEEINFLPTIVHARELTHTFRLKQFGV